MSTGTREPLKTMLRGTAGAKQIIADVIDELVRDRFGKRTIELAARDGVIQFVEVTRTDQHKLV